MKKRAKWIIGIAAFIAAAIIALASVPLLNAAFSSYEAETGITTIFGDNEHEQSTEIKVVTYNIAHCRGALTYEGMGDIDQDLTIHSPEQVYKCLDGIAEMLIKEDADIVLLQEIDRDAVWSYGIDFARYLSEKSRLGHYAYGTKYDFMIFPYLKMRANGRMIFSLNFDMGNAILSRHPISSAENKAFDRTSIKEWLSGQESYLSAVISVQGRDMRVISTHFSSEKSEDRAVEANRMAEEARATEMPFFFGGDLNAVMPDAKPLMPGYNPEEDIDKTMDILIGSGIFNVYMESVDPADSKYYTSNTMKPYRTIDYIIPTKDIEIKDYYVVDAKLSDHKPVAAVLKI